MRRRGLIVAALIALAALVAMEGDAWARARGGGGGGGRGSRSYSAPAPPSNPGSPNRSYSQPTQPASPATPVAPQSRGFFGGLMGGIAGFMLGGLLGSLLFGSFGHGFGGIGLMDLLLIGGGIALLVMFLRRRQASSGPPLATAGAYGTEPASGTSAYGGGSPYASQSASQSSSAAGGGAATLTAPPSAEIDRERGLSHVRQMDPSFDPGQFCATASAMFTRVQAAWSAGDIASVRDVLTPEMATEMQGQSDHLRAERRTNRIEQIDIRRAEVTEAWQETGQDFVTVFLSVSMLDYTVDQRGDVVDGSRTQPILVEEYWTFTRPVGPNRWKLSAIQPSS
jgi:predicted lipid-binding transport protein (Tim44 family)